MNLPDFKENWEFYFRYCGLGLITVAAFSYANPRVRYVAGVGFFLLAISFMKKKTETRLR